MFWSTQSTLEETFHAFNDISSPDSDVLNEDRRASAAIYSETSTMSPKKVENRDQVERAGRMEQGGSSKLGKSTGSSENGIATDGRSARPQSGGAGTLNGRRLGVKGSSTMSGPQGRKKVSHSFSIGEPMEGRKDRVS